MARALQDGRRLNVVFTSMIDWIADKPWEFAYDPSRKNFLAVEVDDIPEDTQWSAETEAA